MRYYDTSQVRMCLRGSFRGAAQRRARNPFSRGPRSWIPGIAFGDPGMTISTREHHILLLRGARGRESSQRAWRRRRWMERRRRQRSGARTRRFCSRSAPRACCDLAVAAAEARVARPGVNIGLFCSTPMVALSRAIGRKPAMEMLLTGELIDAASAKALGLVNRVVPAAELSAATAELASQIAGKSALTLKIGKEAFYRQ